MKPWHTTVVLLTLTIVSAMVHNAIYGITHQEEAAFFILTIIFAAATLISLAITVIHIIRYKYFL